MKVADYNDLPDCETYQDGAGAGSSCVPEKGATANSFFRATNYPVGAVDPTNPERVVVTFGSYVNRHSNEENGCVPAGFSEDTGNPLYEGVKTVGACNNDILLSVSDDAGASFSGGDTDVRELPSATSATRQRTTRPVVPVGRLHPRRQAGHLLLRPPVRGRRADRLVRLQPVRVPRPPALRGRAGDQLLDAAADPVRGRVLRRHTGLAADKVAYPAWSDSRNPAPVLCPGTGTPGHPPRLCVTPAPNAPYNNDQEIYVAAVRVPSG